MPSVVVAGGGVIGASVAWHLAARGIRDVRVVDRGAEPGTGSTGRATGGFRAQFSSHINIALSLLAREKLLRFEDEIGADSGYRPYGYLFLARSEEVMSQLRAANELQRSHGVPEARLVDAADARALNPAIADDQIIGGTFSPTDGFIRPMQILAGYIAAARRLGVRFDFGCDVRSLRIDGERVVALETTEGDVRGDVFVNAAGAWASTLGVTLPVAPLRRQVASTIATAALPESMPMTIWTDDGFHLRVRDGRVLLLWPDACPNGFDATFDGRRWLPQVVGFAHARVPALRDVPIDPAHCWAGLYEMTPDRHAIIGSPAGLPNLVLANGSSGHGVMHAPAIGQLVAELIADGRTSLDITPLRPSRFAEGSAIASCELL